MILIEVRDADFDWMLGANAKSERGFLLPPGGVDNPVVLEIVRKITRRLHEGNSNGSWMVVCQDEVVGLCSYKWPPRDGAVEIGYGIAASRRQLGYATRAVGAMIQIAAADPAIRIVTAQTSTGNPASQRVLEKNGFERTGTRNDPEEGEIVTWQKPVR